MWSTDSFAADFIAEGEDYINYSYDEGMSTFIPLSVFPALYRWRGILGRVMPQRRHLRLHLKQSFGVKYD